MSMARLGIVYSGLPSRSSSSRGCDTEQRAASRTNAAPARQRLYFGKFHHVTASLLATTPAARRSLLPVVSAVAYGADSSVQYSTSTAGRYSWTTAGVHSGSWRAASRIHMPHLGDSGSLSLLLFPRKHGCSRSACHGPTTANLVFYANVAGPRASFFRPFPAGSVVRPAGPVPGIAPILYCLSARPGARGVAASAWCTGTRSMMQCWLCPGATACVVLIWLKGCYSVQPGLITHPPQPATNRTRLLSL